jgi:hypothetical protein
VRVAGTVPASAFEYREAGASTGDDRSGAIGHPVLEASQQVKSRGAGLSGHRVDVARDL